MQPKIIVLLGRGVLATLMLALIGGGDAWAGDEFRNSAMSIEQILQLRSFESIEHLAVDQSGIPTLIRGRLGQLDPGDLELSVPAYMATVLPLFRGTGEESFSVRRVLRDSTGHAQVRLEERYCGLPIVGAELIVHVVESSGEVTGINGRFLSTFGLPVTPALGSGVAFENALRDAAIVSPRFLDAPELTYVLDSAGVVRLAWTVRVAYEDEQGAAKDRIFADADDGRLVARHALIWHAKYREIYDAGNGTTLPGQLIFQEGASSNDQDAQKAYDHSGDMYDYFWQRHQRDSWDGAGGDLVSSVHYDSSLPDALWHPSAMQAAFGDGDGSTSSGTARALDWVAHEFTHGVTQTTADLIYQNESGALNEAMSDIFGAATEAFVHGLSADTWKLFEDAYTPSTPGDALRYMNNPTADGVSTDYYPERYTGSSDSGGVHWNSGIANLAFYLLSEGGSHPRSKTSVVVPAIGMGDAEDIFYRALSVYMTSSTSFQDARDHTLQAASDLFGGPCGSGYDATQKTWDAVGVPRSAGHDYEPNDNQSQANPLQLYSSYVVGYLCTSGNADWYSVNKLSSSSVLQIALYPPANEDYDVELWQGSQIASSTNTGSGVAEYISWYNGTGTFYIGVVGKNGAYSASASYALSVYQ